MKHWKCWWRHHFQLDGHVKEVIPGAHFYKRKCVRCGLTQEVSTCYGIHFLEKEYRNERAKDGARE